jgi:hypothetical protein
MSDNKKAMSVPEDQLVKFLCYIIIFGVLMGIREEFHSIWVRALVAACAGAVLGALLSRPKRWRQ